MTTLELQLDDDLQAFVTLQSKALGHDSAAAYVESLLAIEKLRHRAPSVNALLDEAESEPTEAVDDAYWKRLESEIFGSPAAGSTP